ncbi:Hypothetical protein SMAX5B_017805 [Scophthalmus maximus]|uniref:Uncharacterized protein n=1 Tax=Scophthalmus maximus TaxID=52904 RepID=A0A2U9BX15_SCOMX|nr:Hypothetical protein SMAX5B_017805 [Scophthalmus maximus]
MAGTEVSFSASRCSLTFLITLHEGDLLNAQWQRGREAKEHTVQMRGALYSKKGTRRTRVNLATAHGIIRSITVRLQTAPWCFLHDLQRLQPDMTVPAFTQFVNCTKGDRTLERVVNQASLEVGQSSLFLCTTPKNNAEPHSESLR